MATVDNNTSNFIGLPKQQKSLMQAEAPIHVVRFNSDGQYCLSGGQDKQVKLWNPYKGNLIKTYSAHGWEVLDVAIALDHSKFASCGGDKIVFVWDVSSGRVIRKISGHSQRVNCVALSLDSSIAVSGSYDATTKVWDLRSNNRTPIQSLEDAKDSVSSIQMTEYEIITSSVDGRIRCYDVRRGSMVEDAITFPVTNCSLSNDRNCLLASSLDGKIRLLDKISGELLNQYSGHANTKYKIQSCLDYSDAYVMSGSEDGNIYFWDLVTSNIVCTLKGHSNVVCSVAAHPKENIYLSASADGTIRLWDYYSSNIQPSVKSKWFEVIALAAGWSELSDHEGNPYFYNHFTGLSTYKKPQDPEEQPFAIKAIGNSPWRIVFTDKMHYFFYNKDTRWAGWFPPEELLEQHIWPMKAEEINDLLDPSNVFKTVNENVEENEFEQDAIDEDVDVEEDPEANLEELAEEEHIIKKPKIERQEIVQISKEEKIQRLVQLLADNNISPFQSWESIVKAVGNHEYFTCIPNDKERKKAFDLYCNIKKQQRNELKQKEEEEAKSQIISIIDEIVTGEMSFTEFIAFLKRQKKDYVMEKKELEQIFRNHQQKLKDESALNIARARESFMQLLKETVEISSGSRWSKVKEFIRDDPRYAVFEDAAEKEDLFYDYMDILKNETSEEKKERLEIQKEAIKKKRQEK